jgi:hypothetical protein
MGRVLLILAVVAVAVAAYGARQGWFSVSSNDYGGSSTYELHVQNDRIQHDREDFLVRARMQLEKLDLQLREMQDKASRTSGQTKHDLDAAIARQQRDLDDAHRRFDELQTTTAEKWDDLKIRTSQALDDLKAGFHNAFSRFQ